MEPIAYCRRCGMRVGWNKKYILHALICHKVVSRSVKLLMILPLLVFVFPVTTGIVFSDLDLNRQNSPIAVIEAGIIPEVGVGALVDPGVRLIEHFLTEYGVRSENRSRIARAIVQNSLKYNIDSKLVASIVIVESRANPFAISTAHAVGIMQIHLPTWGPTADRENLNLFKVEDNIALGVRILKSYIARDGGVWEGVMRYKGWIATPESEQQVDEYVQKVRRIYQPNSLSPGSSSQSSATDR